MNKSRLAVGVLVLGLALAGCSNPSTSTTPVPTVDSVTVTADSSTVPRGGELQFSAVVAGENDPAQTVFWRIVTENLTNTSISEDGKLTVGEKEANGSITVKAISSVDPEKSDTKTVSVSGEALITGVTVTAEHDTVYKGPTPYGKLQFSAKVEGNNPAQTVKWSLPNNPVSNNGITIDDEGLLTVAETANFTSITVMATPKAVENDEDARSKSGLCTVNVKDVTIVTIEIAVEHLPDADEVSQGSSWDFTSNVTAAGASDGVRWTFGDGSNSTEKGSTIDSDTGRLTVSPTEPVSSTLTVKATSRFVPQWGMIVVPDAYDDAGNYVAPFGTATVTVTSASDNGAPSD